MKYLKRSIICMIFFSSIIRVFASDDINFSISNQQVQVGEIFELSIEIDTSAITLESVQFDIPGIENFEIFSQSQSQQYQNINGNIQSIVRYNIGASSDTQGEYSLGPIKLITPEGELEDDVVVAISVGSDIITVQNDDNNTVEEDDIRGLRSPGFPWWGIVGGLLIFFTAFYLCLKLLFSQKSEQENDVIIHVPKENIHRLNEKYFNELKADIGNASSQIFFRRYNTGLRKLLMHDGFLGAETDTLTQLQKKKNIEINPVFSLLKKSYRYEYDDSSVTDATQIKYIEDILKVISG